MRLRKLSITVAGIISAILLLLPGTSALFFSEQALEEVRTVQRREPMAFEDLMQQHDSLGDPAAWSDVAAALADRIPLRAQLTRLLRGAERDLLGRHRFDKVVACPGPWFYYQPALDKRPVAIEKLERALDAVRAQIDADAHRLYLAPAPDKVSIYPEALCSHRADYDAQYADRQALHEHFAANGSPELIDTWTPLLTAKAGSPELLYFQTDTHHNARGATIYAQTLIDAIAPGLWGAPEITLGPTSAQRRDLTELAGLPGPTERTAALIVKRPGVRIDACLVDSVPIDCTQIFSGSQGPTRIRVVSDGGAELLPGRTLILHDSFVEGFLKPVLWQYFEDVAFVHFDQIEPGDLAALLAAHDRVIISRVERQLRQVVSRMNAPAAQTDVVGRLGLEPGPEATSWATTEASAAPTSPEG
jgi:hypothetical protein